MATAKIEDKKFDEPIQYYIDNRLKNNIDYKILPDLQKKDKDCFIAIDGSEGCQPAGEKVLMADGSWKNVENIKKGDLVLSPQEDGSHKYSKVLKTYEWFDKETYEVREKNRKKRKLYSCSHNHIIPMNVKIFPRKNGERKAEDSYWSIRNYQADYLCKLSDGFKKDSTTLLSFPIEKFKGRENCEIEPYSLGVWLGDGHFREALSYKKNEKYGKKSFVKGHWRNFNDGKKIWQREHYRDYDYPINLREYNRELGITTEDIEIIEEVSKHYKISNIQRKKGTKAKLFRFSINGEFSDLLIKYGLQGKNSGNKFIPEKALKSDLEYRKKLLAGLVDTDGYYDREKNSYSITTKSKKLAEDIYQIVRSIGGRGSISKTKKKIKKLGFEGEYYIVNFYLGKLQLPVKLKRKKSKKETFYLSSNRCSIDVKKSSGKKVYGFTLDSESKWYITEDYIITHNSGKSTVALQIGKYADPTLTLDRVVFNAEDFRKKILEAKKGQCVIFDEAFTGLASTSSISKINNTLKNLMMQMRQKNLFVVIVLPSFFLLDKYAAIWRTRSLIHVYESGGRRGYFKVYNRKKKKKLYLFGKKSYSYLTSGKNKVETSFRGRFYGKFALGDEKEEQKYRKKKEEALKETESNPMTAGQVKYRNQRDLLLFLLRKHAKFTYRELENLLGDYDMNLSYVQIRNICAKFGDKDDKGYEKKEKSENNEEKEPEVNGGEET
ncbi:MAG TPA: LAGLIDADG family homing endonuclease, partial [Candidatus Nanoarchaeia archaeon]|nr:LAGLIDADG family homing endonuclease [Candidatus Nanoarchaeia archaeon]